MNWTKYCVSTLAVFVFVYLADWLIHGVLLSGMYAATASVWKQPFDMAWMFIGRICFALAIVYLFARKMNRGQMSTKQCVTYGGWLGVFWGSTIVSCYSYLPVPGMLIFWWIVASIVLGLGSGYVISLTYRR